MYHRQSIFVCGLPNRRHYVIAIENFELVKWHTYRTADRRRTSSHGATDPNRAALHVAWHRQARLRCWRDGGLPGLVRRHHTYSCSKLLGSRRHVVCLSSSG